MGVNGDVQLTPRSEIQNSLNFLVGNCIITLVDNESSVFVCSASKRPVTLNERTVIGHVEKCDDNNILCTMNKLSNESTEMLASLSTNNLYSENLELIEKPNFGKGLSKDEKKRIATLVSSYSDIFAFRNNDRGATNLVTHEIQTHDAMPIKQRADKQAYGERKETSRITNELLDEGIFQFSYSPWSSPVVLVKKKDGNTRFCVDYRQLNSVTKKDNYPLPRIDDALDRLNGAKYFSSMDCDQAYYQVPVSKEDKEKTAFITLMGYMNLIICHSGFAMPQLRFKD